MKYKELVIESKKHGTQTVLIDEEDWDKVNQHKWYIWGRASRTSFYAITTIPHPGGSKRGKNLPIHRLITNPPTDMMIDHINGNGLDNRKENLRICTNAQNLCNQGLNNKNTSGYKGVSWFKITKKWRAQISFNNKPVHIGYYKDVEEAARAYDKKALELHGKFAKLNFPKDNL